MCGIIGWLGSPEPLRFEQMITSLRHRGPDDLGVWKSVDYRCFLGHTRLSIIDTSVAGHQPMISSSGRYIITFNGEIYNYAELRRELSREGVSFSSTTDTEVILESIEQWGIEATIARLLGMFSFGIMDTHSRELTLVIDRLGVKPLYFAHLSGQFVFSSELTAFRHMEKCTSLSTEGLSDYLAFGYIPAPHSIRDNVYKMEPGTFLRYDNKSVVQRSYWSIKSIATHAELDHDTTESILLKVEDLLTDSIRLRSNADVPIGTLLSGGIDSSLVTAVLAKKLNLKLKTFSVAFEDASHNEANYAREIAENLGCENYSTTLTCKAALPLAEDLLTRLDEPMSDSSIVPTAMACKLAREHVKVVLSGDGGDEIFGGYPRYFWANRIERIQQILPDQLRRLLVDLSGRILKSSGKTQWQRINRFCRYINCGLEQSYRENIALMEPALLAELFPTRITDERMPLFRFFREQGKSGGRAMMGVDQLHYLPGDILQKIDRASMLFGIEAREPLLDHRLVELSWSIPDHLLFASRRGAGKYLLRRLLGNYLPSHLVNRPKMGFGMPLSKWLRSDLREWGRSHTESLRNADLPFPYQVIESAWENLQNGRNNASQVWAFISLGAWYKNSRL